MKGLMVVLVCVVIVVATGTGWAEPYRILHKQGAIYTVDSGWTLTSPPYYPGVDWAVDLVADSEGITILHKDGAMWNDTGGWDMSSPPYYPGSNYAQALDAGPEEVRIPISSLPYTITQSGSYYLTGNLTSTSYGIYIEADNVTIDLMGYSLIGPGTGLHCGIYMNGRSTVEVRNGIVTNFSSHGIYEQSSSGKNHRVIEVRAVGNGSDGIHLYGEDHIIKDCTASDNSSYGIYAGSGSMVTGNTAYNNGTYGISTGDCSTVNDNRVRLNGSTGILADWCSTVTSNSARNNGSKGIFVSGSSTVMGNAAYNNTDNGIDAGQGCTVTGNAAYSNGVNGIYVESGATVIGNTAMSNQNFGISIQGNNLVDGNTAYQNNQSSGGYKNISDCATCTWGLNHHPGD